MTPISPDATLLLELLNSTPVEGGISTDALREVREVLRSVALGDAPPDRLASFLSAAALTPSVQAGKVRWTLDAPDDQLFAARAALAWFDLDEERPGRLRACGNPECRLFLIDRSHANRAQWCSMATCGNRMKARRHYQRTRQAAAPAHD